MDGQRYKRDSFTKRLSEQAVKCCQTISFCSYLSQFEYEDLQPDDVISLTKRVLLLLLSFGWIPLNNHSMSLRRNRKRLSSINIVSCYNHYHIIIIAINIKKIHTRRYSLVHFNKRGAFLRTILLIIILTMQSLMSVR